MRHHRFTMMLFLLATLLPMSAVADDQADEEMRVGAGAGLTVAPTFLSRNPIFLGGLVAFEIDVPFRKVGLRISPMIGGGVAPASSDGRGIGPSEPLGFGAMLVDVTLRLRFTPNASGGIGGLLGLASTLDFAFGPSLSPIAYRWGDHHELSLWIGLPLIARDGRVYVLSLLPTVRYAYLF